jgi:hypothetical protein
MVEDAAGAPYVPVFGMNDAPPAERIRNGKAKERKTRLPKANTFSELTKATFLKGFGCVFSLTGAPQRMH